MQDVKQFDEYQKAEEADKFGDHYNLDVDLPWKEEKKHDINQFRDMSLDELNQRIKLLFRREEKRSQKSGRGMLSEVEDLDEFDKIILEITLLLSQGQAKESDIHLF